MRRVPEIALALSFDLNFFRERAAAGSLASAGSGVTAVLEGGALRATSLALTSDSSLMTCQARTSELNTANWVPIVMLKSSGSWLASEGAFSGLNDKPLVSCFRSSSFDSALYSGV